jgi:hypothetical protein
MSRASRITFIVLALAGLAYVASFLVAAPLDWASTSPDFQWSFANSILYSFLHMGAAVLFLVAISVYKATLRMAYIAIASGVVLVGAGLAQVVFINLFGLIQSPWVQYGGIMLPFVAAGLAIYFGVRSMAGLAGVTSSLARLRYVFPALFICVLLAGFLPHGVSLLPELFFDVSNAISVWDVVLYGTSLGLVLKIKSHSGEHYTASMAWLALGLLGSVIITLYVLVGTFITGAQPGGYVLDAMVIIGGLLYLKAGHSFVGTKEL